MLGRNKLDQDAVTADQNFKNESEDILPGLISVKKEFVKQADNTQLKNSLKKTKSRVKGFNLDITFCDVNFKHEADDNPNKNDEVAHSSEKTNHDRKVIDNTIEDFFPRHFLDVDSEIHFNEVPVEFEVNVIKTELGPDDPESADRVSENINFPTDQIFGTLAEKQNKEAFASSTVLDSKEDNAIKGEISCGKCLFTCDTKEELKTHRCKVVTNKYYKCDYCGHHATLKNNLATHIKAKHTMEKDYSCHICPNKFVTKVELIQHIRKHTGEKPYKCQFCGHCAAKRSNLVKHIKAKHTMEKKFSCPICNSKFVTKTHLKEHIPKHTGEKPYKCDYCDHSTARKRNLVKHTKAKHLREFACHICPIKFENKKHLNNHIRQHR